MPSVTVACVDARRTTSKLDIRNVDFRSQSKGCLLKKRKQPAHSWVQYNRVWAINFLTPKEWQLKG